MKGEALGGCRESSARGRGRWACWFRMVLSKLKSPPAPRRNPNPQPRSPGTVRTPLPPAQPRRSHAPNPSLLLLGQRTLSLPR